MLANLGDKICTGKFINYSLKYEIDILKLIFYAKLAQIDAMDLINSLMKSAKRFQLDIEVNLATLSDSAGALIEKELITVRALLF